MAESRKGTQLEVPGTPPAISPRDEVEDSLNWTILQIGETERLLRGLKGDERRLRMRLASLPREG